jgi:ATP-dependent DNA helicase RecG
MYQFANGELQLLVATTVIEVGIDVPDATIMVIEHAERFGLSQLHQLRGRVGRGDKPSSCLLLYASPLGEISKARLQIMRESEDGFRIAEEDLRLRGGGEVLGTRQSGLPSFKMANLDEDSELLMLAREEVEHIMATAPDLTSDQGQALKNLLYVFDYDTQMKYVRSG